MRQNHPLARMKKIAGWQIVERAQRIQADALLQCKGLNSDSLRADVVGGHRTDTGNIRQVERDHEHRVAPQYAGQVIVDRLDGFHIGVVNRGKQGQAFALQHAMQQELALGAKRRLEQVQRQRDGGGSYRMFSSR